MLDLNRTYDRKLNNAAKFDELEMRFGRPDLIPLWVADMDYPAPEAVTKAIMRRAEQGIFGYTSRPDTYYDAMIQWYLRRHNWEIESNWILHSPTVVTALGLLVEELTDPGDGILIQSPVYTPFYDVVLSRGRKVLENHLIMSCSGYVIDFEDLDRKLADAKLMILCNPHNPVGRVWTLEELMKIGKLCLKHGVQVISDEIHADFTFVPNRYTPFASLSEEMRNMTITCLSASKTFNIAGLQSSFVILPRKEDWTRLDQAINRLDIRRNNCFGLVAVEAAYRYGEEWLEQMLDHLQGNIRFIQDYLAREIHEIIPNDPEGTYLLWLDCNALGMDDEGLSYFMIHEARVALNAGINFGPTGSGFMRMNVACSRETLQLAMDQIRDAVDRLRKKKKLKEQ